MASNKRDQGPEPLPLWVTILVVLTLLATLVYNVIKFGPDGYPTTMILGGLLGAYAGFQEYRRKKSQGGDDG